MSSLPPPKITWTARWDAALTAAWREDVETELDHLLPFEKRGRARLAGVGELNVLSAQVVQAVVAGRDRYTVVIVREEHGVEGRCTCPYSSGYSPCKHVWAALQRLLDALSASAQGSVAPPQALVELSRLLDFALASDAADGSGAREGARRLAWRISSGAKPRVEPCEQVLGRRGWSPGRAVSMSQLLNHRRTDPHVEAVLRLSFGRSYYNALAYLDGRQVLHELIGAPHVFFEGAPERPLQVERGEVAVRLTGEGDAVRLQAVVDDLVVTTPLEPDDGVAVAIDAAAGRVVVGKAPRAAKALLARLAENPLTIPATEGATVLARLAQLERVLPVRLPDEGSWPEVPADGRLRLLLEPRGQGGLEGLRASLRVRPLARDGAGGADLGPALVPGEGRPTLLCVGEGGFGQARRDLWAEAERARGVADALGLGGHAPGGAATWELDFEASLALLGALEDEGAPEVVVEWPRGQRLRATRELDESSFRIEVRDARHWFHLEGGLEVDGERIELAVLLNALRSGQRFVALDGGRFVRLSEGLRARLEALRGAARERRGKLELDATAAPVVAEALAEVEEVDFSERWLGVLARLDASRKVSVRVPRGLKARLRDYQREGWAWLKRLSTFGAGACLADDMGLGKTVQTIAVLLDRRQLGPALVVAPTSVVANWARELARFAPALAVTCHRETARDAALVEGLGPGHVLITSYDLARIDAPLLAGTRWGTLVLDEAQRVKNARTKTAEALAELEADWRLALTGTPVENRLSDLWSLFRIVSPGLLGSWEAFRARFAAPIERERDPEQSAALARLIRPYVLRRTKEQVLTELPPRAEDTVEVTLSRSERELYEDARLEAVARLEKLLGEADRDARFQVLAALTRLRQLACHPRLVEESWRGGSAKLTALLERVRELVAAGHRALVFSQFTAHLALVRAALEEEGLEYHYLDGSTPARARQRAIDAFQGGDRPLFLISLKAGGVGLNLTGADYVLHLDPWWNPAVEDQATGRAHRIGQQRPVNVYRFVAKDTVEERILALHAEKRALVSAILDGSDRAGALSTSELVALIRSGGGDAAESARAPTDGAAEAVTDARPAAAAGPRRPSAAPSGALDPDGLIALRQRLGLKQGELADLLGTSQATVSRWERGQRPVAAALHERLARLASRPKPRAAARRRAAR